MTKPTLVGYIYEIRRTGTPWNYIGKTTHSNPETRWSLHKSGLRRGKHSSLALQHAWDRFKEHAFHFRVLDAVVAPPKLSERERNAILTERETAWYLASEASYNANRPGFASYALTTLLQRGSPRPARRARAHMIAAFGRQPSWRRSSKRSAAARKAHATRQLKQLAA